MDDGAGARASQAADLPDALALLSAVVAALGDLAKVADLDALPLWRDATPPPLQ
jgi:hypothetical protein